MRTCLIGHTGFIGGNLLAQTSFDDVFHSKTIAGIAGRRYDLVVCAGVSAVKWWANQHPAADRAGIDTLLQPLAQVHAERFVLISTVDVLPVPEGATEATRIDPALGQPYGRHRLQVEDFVRDHFAHHHVLRLPGVFGPGLKKNVLYDLLHGNLVDRIDPDAAFQYYDTRRLWADVQKTMALDLPLLHAATPPLRTGDIAERWFGLQLASKDGPHPRYDFRTMHDTAWGCADGYLYSRAQVLADLGSWIQGAR